MSKTPKTPTPPKPAAPAPTATPTPAPKTGAKAFAKVQKHVVQDLTGMHQVLTVHPGAEALAKQTKNTLRTVKKLTAR
jgi:hypothetical protein